VSDRTLHDTPRQCCKGDSPKEKSRSEALLASDVDKVRQNLLRNLLLSTLGRREDGVLEELVPLGERDRLLPLAVLVVEDDGETAELEELVLGETRGEGEGVKVGELRRQREGESGLVCKKVDEAERTRARTFRIESRRVGTCSSSMRSSL
jgi:hypothetical protein